MADMSSGEFRVWGHLSISLQHPSASCFSTASAPLQHRFSTASAPLHVALLRGPFKWPFYVALLRGPFTWPFYVAPSAPASAPPCTPARSWQQNKTKQQITQGSPHPAPPHAPATAHFPFGRYARPRTPMNIAYRIDFKDSFVKYQLHFAQ